MSVEEQLADIADRIVEFRVRDARLDAARRLVESTGSASADEIVVALGDWQPPEGQDLADLVARKAEAALAVAYAEAERQAQERVIAAGKAAKLRDQADAAQAVADSPVDTAAVNDAKALLDAARAAGGDPGRAPAGRAISVTPQGAEG